MTISSKAWIKYVNEMKKLDDTASDKVAKFIGSFKDANGNSFSYRNAAHMRALVDYSYGISAQFGEGASALACEMYDAIAEQSGKIIKAAEPAEVASYQDVSRAVRGASAITDNDEYIASQVGRMVKRTGADTVLINAKRDGAEFAWIPNGDTCAFCVTLASKGWQKISANTFKNGHAEHIHANCDCEYAVRFDKNTNVKGYDPEVYRKMYDEAEGRTPKQKIDAMRRTFYAENKGVVGDESSKAEELLNFSFTKPSQAIIDFEEHARDLKNERAIITTPEGDVWATSQGGKRSVVIDTPKEAGYIFSHNHPIPANFSVEDVKGLEKSGYKQIRAVSPDKTYILEALNPVQIKDAEDRLFTGAMADAWEKLDEESAKKRRLMTEKASEIVDRDKRTKFAQREMQKILDWRMSEEDKWLKENASKYGYRYKAEKVK